MQSQDKLVSIYMCPGELKFNTPPRLIVEVQSFNKTVQTKTECLQLKLAAAAYVLEAQSVLATAAAAAYVQARKFFSVVTFSVEA